MDPGQSRLLRCVVGWCAITAPLLHSLTDAMEWYQQGFSSVQLWLNYLAFLPLSWLLLGLLVAHEKPLGAVGLAGALLYGAAFTYFAHTTLYALTITSPSYEMLWQQLGTTYTVHGALMVAGGLLFTAAALRAPWRPRWAVVSFGAGLVLNLVLALLPAPDLLQTLGTLLRNAGLIGLGHAMLVSPPARNPQYSRTP